MRVFRCDGYYQEAMRLHGFLRYGGLMSNRFKHARPFLGIIVLVNGSKFCIPFSSNSHQKKKNFESMRENITFRKICDKDGKILAALNLNNMIPVREEYITEIDLKIHQNDTPAMLQWKKLCIKELNWCQSHQSEIERLANELYRLYTSNEPFEKRKICLNFPALEKECNKNREIKNKQSMRCK